MYRIDQPTAVASIPTPPAAGTQGYFTKGDPSVGAAATIVDQDWLNRVQEELMSILTAAGTVPSKTTYNQVLTSLQALFVLPANTRKKLTGSTTYYIATTGNDSTGTGAIGAPWLTIQHAITYIQQNIDSAGYTITISVADGTYTGSAVVAQPIVGGGTLLIQGNTTTPTNCIISTTTQAPFTILNKSIVSIAGFKLTTTSAHGIVADSGAVINITGPMNYGACGGGSTQIVSQSTGSLITISGNYTISGGAACHMQLTNSAEINCVAANTITVTGTPAFSQAFIQNSSCATALIQSQTYSGSATGVRYNVTLNGIINTGAGGANYFPGNSVGTTSTGGQYA